MSTENLKKKNLDSRQVYIPIHKRKEMVEKNTTKTSSTAEECNQRPKQNTNIRRKGRGQFKAPDITHTYTNIQTSPNIDNEAESNDSTKDSSQEDQDINKITSMMKDTSLNEESSRKETRRPRTTDVVAKRLIGHALGIKMAKTPEEKHVDDALLRTTRERRQQEKECMNDKK
ncbi:hypothetical protein RMATCC62417_05339 [Rhizopus microsporus]|nr:hypothetical protein RMATCC62417_05339 [Rhizopus microsporus]